MLNSPGNFCRHFPLSSGIQEGPRLFRNPSVDESNALHESNSYTMKFCDVNSIPACTPVSSDDEDNSQTSSTNESSMNHGMYSSMLNNSCASLECDVEAHDMLAA